MKTISVSRFKPSESKETFPYASIKFIYEDVWKGEI